jgi:hypothetical protein
MKRFIDSGLCALAAGVSLMGAGAALAQSESQPQSREYQAPGPGQPQAEAEEPVAPEAHHADHLLWSAAALPYNRFHADDLVGSEARSLEDEPIGEVITLVFDEDGRILAAVVETGGVLGLGGKAVAIPWEYARPVQTGDREYYLLIEIDPESLEEAPEYDRD